MKKFLSLFLALVMVLSLSACGKDKASTPIRVTRPKHVTIDAPGSVGSFILSGVGYVVVYYSEDSKVVAITDSTGAPAYTELNGESCPAAISQILKTNVPQVVNNLLVKQTVGSQTPSEDFLETIANEARSVLSPSVTVVLCSAEEQSEAGYFSAETAQALLAAYLGNPENATYATTTSHEDGYHEISITIEDRTDLFIVDAYFGSIEILSNNTESEGPESYDFYIEGDDPEFNAGLEPEIPEMLD